MSRRLLAVMSVLLIAGCGGTAASNEGSSPPPPSDRQVTITVTSTYDRTAANGGILLEGALADVVLYDANGHQVARRMTMPGKPVVFRGLPQGQYVLAPALQPCDGNCGTLDGRTDSCRTRLDVQGDVRVRVHYQIEGPCIIFS